MTDTIELRVFHLLCAKLCHDLVSPVGAVSNGVELLRDMGPEDAAEILDLIEDSSGKAAERLKYFRVAYGLAADAVRTDVEAKALAVAMFGGHAISIDWPTDPAIATPLNELDIKLVLNMLLLAAEALPRGGTIAVRLVEDGAALGVELVARGEGAVLAPELAAGLASDADVAGLTPRTVQGFFTARYARSRGGALAADSGADGGVRIACMVPASR